ncbi:DUF839 domain-containing protein [Engelhardtia mirabilis]|uniref:Phytase-like domain-containing protein n=1 Tax=Engelhardtia mirabilis TaxID=2528011 RepID=A0A518BNC4_9BACT|nr:hypothetical protein Pla133_35730 [Planctomycetes bacterium Pla133]QDV02800.1 hypothetical protein Pla86_35710 [Planctomycetes bacterium Pla86]
MNLVLASPALALAVSAAAALPASAQLSPMAQGQGGYSVSAPLFTVGQTFTGTRGALNPLTAGDYTPPGVLDGLGAFALDANTVRVLANHELGAGAGYPYLVNDGQGGSFSLTGARVSYFDVDRTSRQIVDAGLAINKIYDATGAVATDNSFLTAGFTGLSRLCSAQLVPAGSYGLVDTIFFTGEEDGGNFNPIGGAEWALDVATGDLWQVPFMGRGAWENITPVAIGNPNLVAFILADDTSPFDADGDGIDEAAPLFAYVGVKNPAGGFLGRNGLKNGQLFVWVSSTGETSPLEFKGSGFLNGGFVPINNKPIPALASEDGSTGFDEYGFPTQRNLWIQAEQVGAFGFSRPEDVATNPADGTQIALASTGVDTYAVDPDTGDGVDTFGTVYVLDVNPTDGTGTLIIVYDGDADPKRTLRSPDNLDWADDGFIYAQEDKAETDTLNGELLFGPGAVNTNEAGIVRLSTGSIARRVANIDRNVVLDASLVDPIQAVDVDAGSVGAWESSGILDVSSLFGEQPGHLFLIDIQAHGIDDQDQFNAGSRLTDNDLVEGGQLLFLER